MKKLFAASGSAFGFWYRKSAVLRIVGISLLGVLLFWACASAPPQKPKDLDPSILTSAWENLWKNNYALAESSFKKVLAARPKDPLASRGLALALYAKGQDAEAASYALASMESDFSSPFVSPVQSFALEVIPDGKKSIERLKQFADEESAKDRPAQIKRLGKRFLTEYYRFYSPDAGKMRSEAEGMGALEATRRLPGRLLLGHREGFHRRDEPGDLGRRIFPGGGWQEAGLDEPRQTAARRLHTSGNVSGL